MDSAPSSDDSTAAARSETAAEKQLRLAWEAERIVEARADVAAGRLVSSAKVKAWIDSIGSDHELPVPYSTN
jgi:predicted transcriptional regulator